MPTIIEVGAIPAGALPIEWSGGLATALSGSPNEISRSTLTDQLTGNLIHKRVIMGAPTITVTLQGGTPPDVGATISLAEFGVSGDYRVISNAPSGSSGELPTYSIVCEDFSL